MPKETGLLLSLPMLQAYMRGEKIQTRRTHGLQKINQNPDEWELILFRNELNKNLSPQLYLFRNKKTENQVFIKCPCGQVGNEIYWKETLYRNPYFNEAGYLADNCCVVINGTIGDMLKWRWEKDILPAIFMPKEASRFRHIPLLDIRVQRVQGISPADTVTEGVIGMSYQLLWDSTNGKRSLIVKSTGLIIPNAYAWERNPWVFAYTFPAYEGEK